LIVVLFTLIGAVSGTRKVNPATAAIWESPQVENTETSEVVNSVRSSKLNRLKWLLPKESSAGQERDPRKNTKASLTACL
jgi:hypothetical protein